jgi:hypothetical protein
VVIVVLRTGPEKDFAFLVVEAVEVVIDFPEDLACVEAIVVGVVEHEAQDVPVEGTDMCGKRNALQFNHLQVPLHAHPVVASLPSQHLVEDDPQGPDIALLRVMVVPVGFGRHVLGRANVVV